MRSTWFMTAGLLLVITLTACRVTASGNTISSGSDGEAIVVSSPSAWLNDDYTNALSIQGQLAAGTLLLEDTDQAIDETLAVELLPLWQAVQSLGNSDTAAPAEIEAVLNQIQDTMTPEQVAAIADMKLTGDSLTALLEEGGLALGFGRGQGQTNGDSNQPFPGGGFPGWGPGGIPGGGGFPGGGPGGGVPGGLDPQALATRQAQFAGEGTGSFQERALTGAVLRLLGTKTGEFTGDERLGIFEVVFEIVSEATGLTMEEIQAQTAGGTTLAEIVKAQGCDVEAVRAALVDALGELPNAGDLDLEALASQWLSLDR